MTNVERYLEARRERDAIKRAVDEEGLTPARRVLLGEAEARVKLAYGYLRGGDLGQLRRQGVRV